MQTPKVQVLVQLVQVQLVPRPLELVLVQPVLFVVPMLQIPVPLEQALLTVLQQARLVQVFWAGWSLPLLGPKLFAANQEAGNHSKVSLKSLPHPV